VLRHEDEHRRARDPFLLAFAIALVVLLPWNVGVLWQVRRLRLAVELDCDARVLGAEPHPERYGLLLLTIAQRRSHGLARLITSLLEPAHHLGERITAMQSPVRPVSRVRPVLLAASAAGFVLLACTMNPPGDPVSPSAVTRERVDSGFIEIPAARTALDSTRYTLDKLRYTIDSLQYVIGQMRQLEVRTRIDSLVVGVIPTQNPVRIEPQQIDVKPLVVDIKPLIVDVKPLTVEIPARVRVKPDTIPLVQQGVVSPVDSLRSRMIQVAPIVAPPTAQLGAVSQITAETVAPRQATLTTPDTGRAMWEFQVATPARWIPGSGMTKYPAELKAAGIQGSVLAQFVVDTAGRADMSTFKALRSSHERFTEAVRNALPTMRFTPAALPTGRSVKQVIQQEFSFTIQP
jgi:TonB family protein